ncbi:hypothetical protein [Pseudomonas sp.]|uniref:hypothetical protein n=1 Tax=Pseudomonas sp. TaxID=306 RepID=UPI0027309563|nr:hypothetical protein [Pseudomonas sp.]MDP2244009.1 hypothetical protein [Pseudomonas sp.]
MNLPQWGWPWHGRVDTTGRLHLLNGTIMPYLLSDWANHTYRVKVPGVAPVARTTEELAADYERGREWRNEAIMQGLDLYGQSLGGWIYSAPDDSRWIIRLSGSATRFGVLGGAPAEQTLTVAWPADDIQPGDELTINSSPVVVKRWILPVDIAPDGARAIYMLYVDDPAYNVGVRKLPVGFQLVTVTGETGAITLEISTVRTMQQTLGTAVFGDGRETEQRTNRQTTPQHPGTSRHLAPDRLKSDDPPGTVYATGSAQTGADYAKIVGPMSSNVTGRILALWFGSAGDVIECTIDRLREIDLSFPAFHRVPYEGNPDERDRWARVASRFLREEGTLRVAGEAMVTFWNTERSVRDSTYPSLINTLDTYEWELDDGRGELFETLSSGSSLLEDPLTPPGFSQRVFAGNQWRLLTNNVAVLLRDYYIEGAAAQLQYYGCATPHGLVSMSGVVVGALNANQAAGPLEFACFNPFTGEVSDPAGDTMTFV